MAYIAREDGEHFVIPSYREVLSAKQKSLLKRDILTLSQSYGEYITLQQKSPIQYEVAFSPDTGYLLGETVWHQFKRPPDMIYCEAIPGSTEAIMVIVKSGSVYLDGSFPMESIPEELIIFLTQENNFEIFIYGDVPISQTPENGKFNFEPHAVKSFTVLDAPAFATLPLLKQYRLQLVEPVLKAHGIGVFPIQKIVLVVAGVWLLWMAWSYLLKPAPEVVQVVEQPKENPYQLYNDALTTPAPDLEAKQVLAYLQLLFTMPGWDVKSVEYERGTFNAAVVSNGSKAATLIDWANRNGATVEIKREGLFVMIKPSFPKRPIPPNIYPLKNVLANFIDRLSLVYPGNHLQVGELSKKAVYTQVEITVSFNGITPVIFGLISEQLQSLPITLKKISMTVTNGSLTGSIIFDALGS
jgi:hypothetical protein